MGNVHCFILFMMLFLYNIWKNIFISSEAVLLLCHNFMKTRLKCQILLKIYFETIKFIVSALGCRDQKG